MCSVIARFKKSMPDRALNCYEKNCIKVCNKSFLITTPRGLNDQPALQSIQRWSQDEETSFETGGLKVSKGKAFRNIQQ